MCVRTLESPDMKSRKCSGKWQVWEQCEATHYVIWCAGLRQQTHNLCVCVLVCVCTIAQSLECVDT